MTGQERDYEAVLSRVLHTTTDQVEPVGDGLTKIRERLSEPWLKRQWWLLRSEFMVLGWLVVVRCESFYGRLRSRAAAATDRAAEAGSPVGAASGAEPDGGPLRSLLSISTLVTGKRQQRSVGPAVAWLRPALAVAGAVVLVVAGVFALGSIRTAVVGLENATGTSTSNSNNGNGTGNTNGGGSALKSSSTPSQGRSGARSPGTSAGHRGTAPSPGPCQSASPPPASPSPASSPTPTTSPTTTPTPTTSPTTTPTPTSTPTTSQAPSTGGIGTTALVLCARTPGGAQPSPTNQATTGP